MPEHWDVGVLELICDRERFGDDGVALSVRNPDGLRDLVFPTDELHLHARQLEMLCKEQNQMWKRATFTVRFEKDEWQFSADFTYPNGGNA